MTCRACHGRRRIYGERYVSEGETECGWDPCAACNGTGEALCLCELPADGVSAVTGRPTCAVCLAREAIEVDRGALA